MTLHRFSLAVLLCIGLGADAVQLVAQTRHPAPPMTHMPAAAPDSLLFHARDAIIRGLAFFSAPELPLDPDAVLLHTYLKDRFGLPELCAAKRVIAGIRRDRGELYKFLCLADTVSYRPDFLQLAGEGYNNITLAGMWYDKLQKPAIMKERIEASPINDAYVATHALWAVSMARQCFHAQPDTILEHRLVVKVKELMEQSNPRWDDQAIEALAMLQYNDPGYVPQEKYIKELVALQNPNGSWSYIPGQEVHGSQHTTVLALWALLQYKPLAWPTRPRNMVLR